MIPYLLLLAALLQQPVRVNGVVLDPAGLPIAGATVLVDAGAQQATATTAADGTWEVSVAADDGTFRISASAAGFSNLQRTITSPQGPVRLELQPQGITERINVSAPGPERLAVMSSATVLDSVALESAPALMLDDQLRSVPGFSLFRRTSSRVANPTTQGVTLRGLSASGASRTLVLVDGVPLNDPFGAWVSWNRVPTIALDDVEVARGASSDTHGNDALGGVVRLATRTATGVQVRADMGGQGTSRLSGYGGTNSGRLFAGAAAEAFDTDGYVTVAPESRGVIDVPATDRSRAILGWAGVRNGTASGELRGGYLGEERGNGTPQQVNGTVTRWGAASGHGPVFGGAWEARGDLMSGNYRQTFSAVAANRASERLTNLQWVHPASLGAAGSWVRGFSKTTTLVATRTRFSRADLDESTAIAGGFTAPARTPGRQRDISVGIQEQVEISSRVVLEAGASAAWWKSYRADTSTQETTASFLEPRVSLAVDAGGGRTLRLSWLSGFRTPTMNELYRSFRVGNTITQANNALDPEKSRGPEAAFTVHHPEWTLRVVGFATSLQGAIYNRTLSSTAALIQRIRSNGDARAVGSEFEVEWRPRSALALTTSWAAMDSRFTSGELDGKQVPQVPHVQGAVGLRTAAHAFSAALDVRVTGKQFDDDVNAFVLRAGSLVDARAGWRITRRGEIFGAIENAMDTELDTGKTPIRTIGSPRLARAGLSVKF